MTKCPFCFEETHIATGYAEAIEYGHSPDCKDYEKRAEENKECGLIIHAADGSRCANLKPCWWHDGCSSCFRPHDERYTTCEENRHLPRIEGNPIDEETKQYQKTTIQDI